jgi:chemotaxis protein MotB
MRVERKPKYLQADNGGRDRWLISYADVLTVLLILFVAMAAAGTVKQDSRPPDPPPRPPVQATVTPPTTPSPSREKLIQAERKLQQHGLDLRLEPRGLVITLPQAVLFESGDDRINPSALPIISRIVDVLHDADNKIELAGHADTIPIHNKRFRNNWELSAARSLSLLNVLTTEYGIEESRLSVSSYGSYNPKSPNDTPDGRAENRRVEILILDEPDQSSVVK